MIKQMGFLLLTVGFMNLGSVPVLGDEGVGESQAELPASNGDGVAQPTKNKRLQAIMGSTSPVSVKFDLTYYGSSLNHPLAPTMPNPDRLPVPGEVRLSGNVGVNYRATQQSSWFFGTGVSVLTPLQEWSKGDVNNPILSYTYMSQLLGAQNFLSVSGVAITNHLAREFGQLYGTSVEDAVSYEIPKTKFTVGGSLSGTFVGYDKVIIGQRDLEIITNLFAEYAISDRLLLRSVLYPVVWQHERHRNLDTWVPLTMYQSFGLGWSISPVVYFQPYIEFYPAQLSARTTTFLTRFIFSVF